jgi:hypothetical protein
MEDADVQLAAYDFMLSMTADNDTNAAILGAEGIIDVVVQVRVTGELG